MHKGVGNEIACRGLLKQVVYRRVCRQKGYSADGPPPII